MRSDPLLKSCGPSGDRSIGPTAAGYLEWETAEELFLDVSIDWGNSGAAGLTIVFPTSEGNITANIIGAAPNSFLAVVPEPGGLLVFGVGLMSVLALRRPARHVRDAS